MDEKVSIPQTKKAFLIKCLFLLPKALTSLSYYCGLFILSVLTFPKYLLKIRIPKQVSMKSLIAFLLLLIIAATPLALLKVASEGQQLSGKVLGIKDDLITNAESAQSAIKNKDYQLAAANFGNILANLQTAQQDLDSSSIALRSLIKATPDQYNSEHVLTAATLLTESGILGSQILEHVSNMHISPEGLGPSAQNDFALLLTSTHGIAEKLSQANELLAELNADILPAEYQIILKDSQSFVADLSKQMTQLSAVVDIADSILMQDKKFLIVLQNNNELRSTGGFIGTIAQGNFSAGSIKHLDIRSVYDLDGQLLEQVKVPEPMIAVNNRLFLRDSNWMADFAESAKIMSVMYEKEGGETPDLIMSINPELFIELLTLTGPITLPTYKVTLSSENFIETVQTTTSVKYDKNLNQPKQMLADLYPALLQKLNQLFTNNPIAILAVLQKSFVQKDMILYSKDPDLQSKLKAFNWAGGVATTDSDYLHIVSNNLSGTKTDRFLNRQVKLTTTIDEQGSIINQLKYTVENPLPTNTALTNKSWVRFLVPQNSKVLAAEGFTTGPESNEKPTNQTTNSIISNWQNSLHYDTDRHLYSGTEAGKDYFAGWIEVPAGVTTTVTITYQLPFQIRGTTSHYSLLLQKQSGMLPFQFSHTVETTERTVVWENISSKGITSHRDGFTFTYDQSVNQDQLLGLVLKKE